MRYRLLCLDAGFTLLSPRRTLAEALGGVLADHGHAPDEVELQQAWEAADRWFWDEYHRPGNDTWSSDERIHQTWRDYHGLMLRELGLADDASRLVEAVLASQFATDAWEPYPDVRPMLDDVHTDDLVIGIVSDWSSNLAEIFAGLELDRYLDFILASGAVGVAKPDPAFFRMALERAGVEPHEAVMVGDSYRADVLGARAAGMDAILLDRPGKAGPADGPVMRTLLELPAQLLKTDARAPVEVDA